MATSLTGLTPIELWSYVKSRFNRNTPSLVELKDAIRYEFLSIQPEMLHAVVNGVVTRLQNVTCSDGRHLKQVH
ncbi:hypothetical protein TNCT_216271 [Trichonephila clavata]|uniref:Uncharacterized protein n=1 Tax=Trichonephila clavata TaxID=2740835 RepID=A0A8X6HHS9_TRICU|nr:hypothetical protein TNCT_216271 [Trichonephila clavata]